MPKIPMVQIVLMVLESDWLIALVPYLMGDAVKGFLLPIFLGKDVSASDSNFKGVKQSSTGVKLCICRTYLSEI